MAQPGDVLAERWRLVEKIDAGAMGEIFRGAHQLLGHAVAVKVMMPEIARDGVAIERFLREARIAAKLQHRHVVRVEDYGLAADGRPFLVMELLHGESLARRLACTPRLPPREVLAIIKQIASALDTAHAAGIIHRDLKPENVFLVDDPDGGPVLVKVLDFGVAKFTDALAAGGGATTSNTLIGTPRYMSPEQARSSRELDGRSDLWALGMLAYEMLTGRHPFEGEAIAELLVAILTHRIPPPTSVCPELPTALDAWTVRAMARNKTDRFSTGRVLFDALTQALDGCVGDWAPVDYRDSAASGDRPRRSTLRVKRPGTAGTDVPQDSSPVAHPDETGQMAVAVGGRASQNSVNQLRTARNRTTLLASAVAVLAGLSLATVARFAPHRASVTQGQVQGQGHALAARTDHAVPTAPTVSAATVLNAEPAIPPAVVPGDIAVTPAATVSRVDRSHAQIGHEVRSHRHHGRHDGRARHRGGEYDPPGI